MQAFLDVLKAGDLEAAGRLLAAHPELKTGRNEQGASWLVTAIYRGQPGIARLMVEYGAEPDLFEAAMLGMLCEVREGIEERGMDVNAVAPDGFPLVSLAVFFGQQEVFHYLVERGADVNQAAANAMRIAPLHAAAARGDLEAVRLLLSKGAAVNARQQSGYAALHTAAANGRKDMVTELLECGADPAAANEAGETAADLAEKAGHREVVALLR